MLTTLQLGTCAMKPREEGGVVDARLNVYGTQNLKVAGMFFVFPLFSMKRTASRL
jgi:GMC oxidoreductase